MLPNYDRQPFDPEVAKKLAKPRPRLLDKREAQGKVKTKDQQERDKCHERSGRKCEVVEEFESGYSFRCLRPVVENHHLISGIGRRNKGRSILAEHRLDTCKRCHDDITGKVLRPIDGTQKELAATVRYERVK